MTTIHDKIRKLLALGEGQANEHESHQALELAAALMMKHGIDRSELSPQEKSSIIQTDSMSFQHTWQLDIATGVAGLMGCQHIYWKSLGRLAFVGRRDNCDAAEQVYAYILLQVEQFYREALPKGLTQRDRADFRKSFKYAAARRIHQRCWEIARGQSVSSGSTALVLHRAQLEEEIKAYWGENQPRPVRLREVSIRDAGAYHAGDLAGERVEINKEVG